VASSFYSLNEPQVRDLIQLLGPDGLPSETQTRVKSFVSYDRDEELFEVIDTWGRTRIITAGAQPREWLEVEW